MDFQPLRAVESTKKYELNDFERANFFILSVVISTKNLVKATDVSWGLVSFVETEVETKHIKFTIKSEINFRLILDKSLTN